MRHLSLSWRPDTFPCCDCGSPIRLATHGLPICLRHSVVLVPKASPKWDSGRRATLHPATYHSGRPDMDITLRLHSGRQTSYPLCTSVVHQSWKRFCRRSLHHPFPPFISDFSRKPQSSSLLGLGSKHCIRRNRGHGNIVDKCYHPTAQNNMERRRAVVAPFR